MICDSSKETMDETLIHYAVETGALLIDGFGNGSLFGLSLCWIKAKSPIINYLIPLPLEFCRHPVPGFQKQNISVARVVAELLFDLQETTAKIRAVTNHLKGVKIAIMGCIVNGPGEMADADFGYVGSGPGKITLYKSKEVVKRNVPAEIAVDELVATVERK